MRFLIPGVGHQDFERDDPALAVDARQQRLTDDPFEHQRQLHPHLRLLVRREDVDDAVDGRRRRVGVQRRKRQVARFRNPQRRLDRLQIAHFADQDDVRILTQRRPQRVGEVLGVAVDLALVHQATLVLVQVLDRVLDGEDVGLALDVDLVDHRGQGRRLAAAGGAGHEHQTARPLGQLADDRRQPELIEGPDPLGNQTVDRADGAALVEEVAAEAGQAADAEREVQLLRLLEALLLRIGQHAVGQRLGVGRRQLRMFHPAQFTVDAHHRRRLDRQVEVGAVELHRGLEQFWQRGHVCVPGP